MDYGHSLRFGTFVTPTAAQPQAAVQLARLSESLGFDLVTYQDHPYQPSFLDTWTLLSYAAAATERIHLAPNVLNLPLRPAPVTARAAASLDLLSGGRLDLGLGAGGFWDAIEAMGGRRLSPGQAVDALSEAIDIIRGIWAVGDRTVLRSDEYYTVNGAKRGPAPAHDIPIWIGAYKPRMLKLTGEKGDGWLPSRPYMKPGDLRAGNQRIDDAAADVGRDPAEIRRLLNVTGSESLDELTALALDEGVSTFIVMGDDPSSLERFAGEIMAPMRKAVAAERARRGITAVDAVRPARAIALRRDGIAYDDLPESLRADAVEPGDSGYATAKSTYMRGGTPGLVLRPRTIDAVRDALAFARKHPALPLGIRSGGHGISGRSTNDGGIVIDLKHLNDIEVVDPEARRVRIGPGARWTDVAAALQPHGLALSSGDYGGVGVGGLATAGGVGFLAREHGLTIDHLVAADVLLADGTLAHATAEENADLFWAVRGAGANVGIVVSFEFEADVVGDVGWAQLAFRVDDAATFLEDFGRLTEESPRDTTLFLILSAGRPAEPASAQLYGVVDSSDPDTIIARLQPFADLAPLVGQQVQLLPYASVMANASDVAHDGQGEPSFRSGLVRHLDADTARAAAALATSGSAPWFQIRPVGGAVSDVAEDATAYAHRSANFSITLIGRSARFDALWESLAEHFDGLYLSFESRTGEHIVEQAFPPATLAKLRAIKQRVDPDAVLRDNFGVHDATGAAAVS
ncbi:LLM class flavin-dependent oxidoreductase [Agromyces atrinae]|uniref:Alkanesulfonate monooxygenase SsuD/methylene tetrahydromethanopterin reductase-like flavin-dependent oxidoreductase (Luciferase family)/FAD/FMN-containing dehydrogenase n=1 Tax=Agromyces atrinae TaxID=592376 RepID=A0A4Q2M9R2_9MICO|nr:LLM class flavin-dependent oxidoreductase [Agromyces atrinae]NYD66331.1 alkanesulfonate monooxygenase SsuD/methylene tetrahydromethanopterin reductase-like flavin-dependent oxidoreductase (luciferase family)/FAD/FMN-containing dehydrogenase [Agromyces atrinae]RXZ86652.1 LLM class flavin-dependent oxidoreductase [Agromyces atrinae]